MFAFATQTSAPVRRILLGETSANSDEPRFGAPSTVSARWKYKRKLAEAVLGAPSLQKFVALLILLLLVSGRTFAQTNVVIDFDQAGITGRWVDSWADKGVLFTPAHAPARSQAKARLMFFPHLPSGHKGILSAMADDPIPVRAQFTNGCSSVTLVLWGSTGCPAKLEARDAEGKLLDQAALDAVPGRKAPGDPIPTCELTVKGTNIAYIEFSGPRPGEYLAAEEVRFVPILAATK